MFTFALAFFVHWLCCLLDPTVYPPGSDPRMTLAILICLLGPILEPLFWILFAWAIFRRR